MLLSSTVISPNSRPAHRFPVALAAVLILVPAAGVAQQPAPVSPTVPFPTIPGYVPASPTTLPGAPLLPQPYVKGEQPAADNGATPKATPPELTLGECIAVALDRQPALRAVKASQNATQIGSQALNNIGRLGKLVSPDLPIRKEQASRGVIAAAADIQKMHNEIVQDVTRLYYTVVYATQQEVVAADAVADLDLLVKVGRKYLAAGLGEMTQAKLDLMIIGLNKARSLQASARIGTRQAYAALREVMAADEATFPFQVKRGKEGRPELPLMAQRVPLTKDQVVEMALCRRPELALAAAGVDAFRLEVYAQGRIPFRRAVPTLASGSDIHARMIPPGSRDKDYRPEPIVPEMPPQLVGSKADRVTRAMAYSQRAEAVYEKARNLVILEAETAFLNLELANERLESAKAGFTASESLRDYVRGNIENVKSAKELLLSARAEAAKAEADYYEAVYQYLLALAALERVTAGGVRPAFPGR